MCVEVRTGAPVEAIDAAGVVAGATRIAARTVLWAAGVAGEPTEPFAYADKGSLATIGRSAAVADVFGLHFSGLAAWLTWLFVHVMYLVGFRNRMSVLFDWAWAYVTYLRGTRVIFPMRDVREEADRASERAAS